MEKLHFQSIINIYNVNPYVFVTAKQAETLQKGWRKPMPVLVQINGKPDVPWPINMMPVGDGNFYLYLHGDVRTASHTKVGDRVTVDLSFDTKYQSGPTHPMPDWFRIALDANPRAKQTWDGLIPSRQKEVLRYFAHLSSPDAKQRNLKKAITAFTGGKDLFLGRTWS
jgi:hypothetical protein